MLETIKALRKSGHLPDARDMLLEAAPWDDPQLTLQAIMTLNELEDVPNLHKILPEAMRLAAQNPRAGDDYLLFLHRRSEQYCLDHAARTPLARTIATRLQNNQITPESPLDRAWKAGRIRSDFGQRYRTRQPKASFIPLGLNCLPWVLVNRWDMQTAEDFARNLSPFAMAVHTLPGVIAALQDGFLNYTNPEHVMTITAPGGRPVVMRKDRGATWVHHDNAFYFKDNYANLRTGMAERVQAFRNACRAPVPVFMLNYVNVDYPRQELKFLPALQRALSAYTGHTNNHIFMSNVVQAHEGPQIYNVTDTTSFFYCTLPEKGFQWNLESNLDTEKAIAFEQSYISRIVSCMLHWNLLNQDAPPTK